MFAPSLKSLIEEAQALLEQRAPDSAPVVLWQRVGEAAEAFDKRIALARTRLPDSRALLAVCSGPRTYAAPDGVRRRELPPKLHALLHPSRPARYRIASGGRGSGKSFSYATALILRAVGSKVRVLCCREIQRSVKESVLRLLADRIEAMGLGQWFDIGATSITCMNGSEFIFEGLHANITKIKSLEGVQLCWCEESERISERSWETLIPTIRTAGSEIWATLNPDDAQAATFARFVTNPPPATLHEHVIYSDNPWFPVELERERAYLQSVDDDAHRHVWEGQCRTASDAQILKGKYFVEEFVPGETWDGPYFGVDFGFSQDPTVMTKAWIHERTLYIEREAWQVGCDIDRLPGLFDTVPGSREHASRADSARPETISYLQKHGFGHMQSVQKWSGSVEDGIAHLRQYERIVIHPRCTHIVEEFRLYSYKVDRLSGDVLPDVVDAFNHGVDALRYSLQPLIRQGNTGFLEYLTQQVAAGQKRKADTAPSVRAIEGLGSAMTPGEIANYKRRHGRAIH